jgi:hypothetical protein
MFTKSVFILSALQCHILRKLCTEVKVELTVAVELKRMKIMQFNIAECEKE